MKKIPTTHTGDYGRLHDLKKPYRTSQILGQHNNHSCVCVTSPLSKKMSDIFVTGK